MDIEENKEFLEFLIKEINTLLISLPVEMSRMMLLFLMLDDSRIRMQQEIDGEEGADVEVAFNKDALVNLATYLNEIFIPENLEELTILPEKIYNEFLYSAKEKYHETKAKTKGQAESLETVH